LEKSESGSVKGVAMKAIFYVVVLLGLANCHFAVAQGQTEQQSDWKLSGQIVNSEGSPIKDAAVNARFSCSRNDGGIVDRIELGEWKAETDSNGKFHFDVANAVPDNGELNLQVWAQSELHYNRYFFVGDKDLRSNDGTLDPMELRRGVLVSGQVAAPPGKDQPLNPTVEMMLRRSAVRQDEASSFFKEIACDQKGNFKLIVPEGTGELTIAAQNYRSTNLEREIKIAGEVETGKIPQLDLGKLTLDEGVTVFGTATLENGDPASGVVVGIIEWKDGDYGAVGSAKTDQHGKFQLPPRSGKCSILVLKACRSQRIIDGSREVLKTDGELPVFDSVELELDGKGRKFELSLKEAESVSLAGKVQDPFGNPAAGSTIEFGWETEHGNLEVDFLTTDKQGRYIARMAKGRKPVFRLHPRTVNGKYFSEAVLTKAIAQKHPDLITKSSAPFVKDPKFKSANSSTENLNWTLMDDSRTYSSSVRKAGDALRWWLIGE
jgi:5-hydroxyisourate hydrolase-like protein (transthyretin family)